MVFVSKIIIGVVGAGSRTGCTHTGIVLANFLRNQGQAVAVLEMNGSGCFETFCAEYGAEKFDGGFTLNGIDYYPECNAEKFMMTAEKNYSFFILDFGNYINVDKKILKKCDIPIVCAGVKPWEISELEYIFNEQEETILQKFYFCFLGAIGKKLQKEVKKQMEPLTKIWFPKIVEDPFQSAELPEGADIFDAYVVKKDSRKNKIFGRKN